MSTFDSFLEANPNWNRSAAKEWDEGSDDLYDIMKRPKDGKGKAIVYKQIEKKGKADAYAKIANQKSTTHIFTVRKS
jgi:hypothetical protein